MKKILKRTSMYVLLFLGGYLAIGYLLHLVVFPEKKPDIKTYFKPGQEFYSKAEGVRQTVVKHEDGWVYCSAEIEPFADGPPKHIHANFDETFEVAEGELSVWMDGKVYKLRAGDSLYVPQGAAHKPFNETAKPVKMKRLAKFPEKFAFNLVQVYGMMDCDPKFGKGPGTMMQMTLLGSSGFDSYLAEGPPLAIQKATGFLLTPLARLMGYKSFYSEYDIRK